MLGSCITIKTGDDNGRREWVKPKACRFDARCAALRGIVALVAFSANAAFAITGGLDEPSASQSVLMLATRGMCSASVIAPRVLLTAAHCVSRGPTKVHWRDKSDARRLSIVGEIRARFPTADLALIRLTESLPEQYLLLTLTASTPTVGERVWLVGYGEAVQGKPATSRRLRSVEVSVVWPTWTRGLVWTDGAGKAGACAGDSGGPMLRMRQILAVTTSINGPCGTRQSLGILVSDHRSWIDETLVEWGAKATWDLSSP